MKCVAGPIVLTCLQSKDIGYVTKCGAGLQLRDLGDATKCGAETMAVAHNPKT